MKKNAQILKVLIASPSDVTVEREKIPEIINEWNALLGDKLRVFLQPIKWETHAIPALGDRPQAILNSQIVQEADILIGIFWTRIGTSTGQAISGTLEEIEEFKRLRKPVMLYFSEKAIPPSLLDIEQFTKLNEVKQQLLKEGVVFNYSNINDFKELIFRHLTRQVGTMIQANSPSYDSKTIIGQLENLNQKKMWGELNELLVEIEGIKTISV